MRNADPILAAVETHGPDFVALADRIWDHPEIAWTEFRASDAHAAMLERHGFRVERDIAGLPTALSGERGAEGPVIAFLGEYDALPGLSQAAGVAEEAPLVAGGEGHGCGHNLLGTGALLAAVALAEWLEAAGLPGRVRYYGCPAEESEAGKTYMVREGVFADVDAAFSWHPSSFTRIDPNGGLAMGVVDFHFSGRAAHAAGMPHLGRSALDAVELMNVGCNYLREHIPPGAKLHYAILDGGGPAPNIVQARAAVRYAVRDRELAGMTRLLERVRKVAEGAAMMTETTMRMQVAAGYSDMILIDSLSHVLQAAAERLGPVPFDDADRDFAARIQASLPAENVANDYVRAGLPDAKGQSLTDCIVPLDAPAAPMIGSTDLGDVSWVVPLAEILVATQAIGTPGHSWQMVAQGKAPAAHKGMLHAAAIMATAARDLIADPALLSRVKADHTARLDGQPYLCPIPPDVKPPVRPRPAPPGR